jgi:hypothetical protein
MLAAVIYSCDKCRPSSSGLCFVFGWVTNNVMVIWSPSSLLVECTPLCVISDRSIIRHQRRTTDMLYTSKVASPPERIQSPWHDPQQWGACGWKSKTLPIWPMTAHPLAHLCYLIMVYSVCFTNRTSKQDECFGLVNITNMNQSRAQT